MEALTVHEVSKLAGISVRTLHHYDKIGLLTPATRTDAGYRLYSEADLARLQQILLFRELEFPLDEIRGIIDSPAFNRAEALKQQIQLLRLKRERIDGLIELAKKTLRKGATDMSFDAFDTTKIDDYAARAKATWGATPQWAEYEKKSARRTAQDEGTMAQKLMNLFIPFGRMAAEGADPTSSEAKAQAATIQQFITKNYYHCSDEVFAQLGASYGAGGEFTQNIDAAAGPGAGAFAAKAVAAYCSSK